MERIGAVSPVASSKSRVSCTISPARPASSSAACLATSQSTARAIAEKLFMFLTSTLVPSSASPFLRTETLTSQRIPPSCIAALETPR